jgi:hypothetical protein
MATSFPPSQNQHAQRRSACGCERPTRADDCSAVGSPYVAIGGELSIEGPDVDIYASGTGAISLDLNENPRLATPKPCGCEINGQTRNACLCDCHPAGGPRDLNIQTPAVKITVGVCRVSGNLGLEGLRGSRAPAG